jgi:hypothetical protein
VLNITEEEIANSLVEQEMMTDGTSQARVNQAKITQLELANYLNKAVQKITKQISG